MQYNFTEEEYNTIRSLLEDISNMSDVLLCYLEANTDSLAIYTILALYKHIQKTLGKTFCKFVRED